MNPDTQSNPIKYSNSGINPIRLPDNLNTIDIGNLNNTNKDNIFIPPVKPLPEIDTTGVNNYANIVNDNLKLAEEDEQLKKYRKTSDTLYKDIADFGSLLTNRDADIETAYNTGLNGLDSVNTYTKQARDITNQILSSNNFDTQQKLLAENQGGLITSNSFRALNNEISRNTAIRNLNLGTQLAAVQGNLSLAKSFADRMIEAKYAPIQAKLDNAKTLFDINEKLLTIANKRAYDRAKSKIEAEQKDLDRRINNDKIKEDIIISSAVNGAPQSLIEKAQNAKSPFEASILLAKYNPEAYKNEKIKLDIAKTKAEINKTNLDIAKTKAEIRKIDADTKKIIQENANNNISIISGNAVAPDGNLIEGLPNDILRKIGSAKLTETEAKAVSFASRMIEANKKINEQIGKVKDKSILSYLPFTKETTGYDPTNLASSFGSLVNSDAYREYDKNFRDFVGAALRRESGAVITEDEFKNFFKIYRPSGVGQDESDIKDTAQKRDTLIKSVIVSSGKVAAPLLLDYYASINNTDNNSNIPLGAKIITDAINNVSKETVDSNITKDDFFNLIKR